MDAIVIGAGPNGLVGANLLTDEGWDVLVLEEQAEPGGAVKTAELTVPGFRHDVFSAFYPLAAASPTLAGLHLEEWGLRWRRAPVQVGHATRDGAALMWADLGRTAAALDDDAPGDGAAWRELFGLWERAGDDLVAALLAPFPPVVPAVRLGVKLRRELLDLARLTVLPLRRLQEERFDGSHAGLLLAGNAAHADLTPEMPLSGFLGFLLCGLAQRYGFPAPEGGAGSLTAALVARLRSRGGRIECGRRVDRIDVRNGAAVAVVTADGESHPVTRAVLADVSAPALYRQLLPEAELPSSVLRDVRRFHLDNGTVKVDWALDRHVPWSVPELGEAGTIHTGDDLNHISASTNAMARGVVAERPTLVIGQMNAADPSRSPEGTATLWAYAHVPQVVEGDEAGVIKGQWDDGDKEAYADRIEGEIERHAPGFRDIVKARHVMSPRDLEAANRNLIGGAVNGGTSQIHQQLFFRPTPGLARPETPIDRLYLASASAHPGGGVHGACGANAARAALFHDREKKTLVRAGLGLGAALVAARAVGKRRGA